MIHHQAQGVTVFHSALYKTTSTVIETTDLVLVVDPAWLPEEVAGIRAYVDSILQGRPLYLLFTHSDWDHVIGWKAFPTCTTIASRAFVDNPDKSSVLERIDAFDQDNYIERTYDIAYPSIDVVVEQDGQQLNVGATTLTFYLAPGHTSCGMFTIVQPSGVFLAGDYLSDIEFPFIDDSSESYLKTMTKVREILHSHDCQLLVPGHGTVTCQSTDMLQRVDIAVTYIEQLRTFLATEDQTALDGMLTTWRFAKGLRRFHDSNQRLVKEELNRLVK